MGHYVHLSVIFACDQNDAVADLAKRHLTRCAESHAPKPGCDICSDGYEARAFLTALSERSGGNPGPKGGLSLWGMIGNYTNGESFVEALRPFWYDLLMGDREHGDAWGGPLDHEHILVFVEHEQSEQAEAFEIFLEETDTVQFPRRYTSNLIVRHHENLPFAWHQM